MEELSVFSYVIFLPYLRVYGDSYSTIVPLNFEQNSTNKSYLRYGFQKTSECLNFEKSFLCIQKCLDLNFDVAYADKKCKCTCHVKKEKAKFTLPYNFTRTKWKLGAPTTSIPHWAQDKNTKEVTEADIVFDVNENDPADSTVYKEEKNVSASTSASVTSASISSASTNNTGANDVQVGNSSLATGQPVNSSSATDGPALNSSIPNSTETIGNSNSTKTAGDSNSTKTTENSNSTKTTENSNSTKPTENSNSTVKAAGAVEDKARPNTHDNGP